MPSRPVVRSHTLVLKADGRGLSSGCVPTAARGSAAEQIRLRNAKFLIILTEEEITQ